jgi:MFS family permease
MMTSSQMPLTAGQPEHRWWILAVLASAQLMVALDATVVSIALPHAQASLHFSSAARQWTVTAYALTFGSLLLLSGRLADIYGRKRLFLIGVAGFAAASAAGGASESFAMLVAARAAQGAFGAALAAVHSYTVAFWVGTAILTVAALTVTPLLRPGLAGWA